MWSLKAFHIETRLFHRVNNGFHCMCFAIARRSNKQYTSFPGDTILFVSGTRCKELRQVVEDVLLEVAPQNQIIESRTFNILEEMFILVPAVAIKHQHFTPYLHVPLAHGRQEVSGNVPGIGYYP